jgi:hypothetical protein
MLKNFNLDLLFSSSTTELIRNHQNSIGQRKKSGITDSLESKYKKMLEENDNLKKNVDKKYFFFIMNST